MKILKNESLKKYTSIKVGGIAKKMIIPESKYELIEYVRNNNCVFFLGGGSNLLIGDGEFEEIVNLREFDKKIESIGNGKFNVGASVSLHTLIKEINKCGYGGIEYLYSVPGLVGGAVAMNAGRGKTYNKSISDFVKRVEVLKDSKVIFLDNNECRFTYRNSIFKNSQIIILSVEFEFKKQELQISKQLCEERISFCRLRQDNSAANFGTVFSDSNKYIMLLLKKLGVGDKNGAHWSKKTSNWILNEGTATFEDIEKMILLVKKIHKFLMQSCMLEIIIWNNP